MFTGQLLWITDQYTTTITCLMVTCIVLHEFLLLFQFLKEVIKLKYDLCCTACLHYFILKRDFLRGSIT